LMLTLNEKGVAHCAADWPQATANVQNWGF